MQPMSTKDVAATAVIKKTEIEFATDYGLVLAGTGGSSDNDKKKTMMSLTFDLLHTLSKEQCRELIVNCVERFLANINQDANLTKFLANVPFTYNNLDFAIFLFTPTKGTLYYPDIAVVNLYKGYITYDTNDPDKRYTYKTSEKESYEEALKIVRSPKLPPPTPPAP